MSPRPIVLLPGLHGTTAHFEPFIVARPPEFEPQPVDYPIGMPQGYPDLAELVCARLPKTGPFLLLGESFSGPVAILVAARQPKGLAGVVLAASFVSAPRCRCLRFLPWRALFAIKPPSFALRLLAGKDCGEDLLERMIQTRARTSPALMAERMAQVFAADFEKELREVKVPLLYLRASRDRLVPQKAADRIRAIRPDATLAEIEGPHLILQTRPRACWEAIQRFTESLK